MSLRALHKRIWHMFIWIVILTHLAPVFCGRQVEVLYNYQFADVDTIPNLGSLSAAGNSLIYTGTPRDSLLASDHGVLIDPRSNQHYFTPTEIRGLRLKFLESNGFEAALRVKLETFNNIQGDACLFCLVKTGVSLKNFNPCKDLDFGIRWKERALIINIRTTESNHCDNIQFVHRLPVNFIGKQLDILFRYDGGRKELFLNGKLQHSTLPIPTPLNIHDVAIWSNRQTLWIGPIKNSIHKGSIQLIEYTLGSLAINSTESTGSAFIDGLVTSRTFPKKSPPASTSPRRFGTHTANLNPQPQLEISVERTQCFSKVHIPVSPLVAGPSNLLFDLFLKHRIPKATPGSSPATKIPEARFQCVDDNFSRKFNGGLNWIHGIHDQYWTLETIASLGSMYQCVYGKDLGTDGPAFESLKIPIYLSDSTCNFVLGVHYIANQTKSTLNEVSGLTMFAIFNQTTTAQQFVMSEASIHTHNDELVISDRVCTYYNSRLESGAMDGVSILQQTGPGLSIGNLTECIPRPLNPQICCYYIDHVTRDQYIKTASKYQSQLLLKFKLADGHSVVLHRYFELQFKMQQPPLPPLRPRKQIVPIEPTDTVLCLFRDEARKIPYRKVQMNQRVYYRILLVPKTVLKANRFSCMDTPRCYSSEIAIQINSIEACTPKKPYYNGASCDDLDGKAEVIVDLSNPAKGFYRKEWNPSHLSPVSNCLSIIEGDFLDILHENTLIQVRDDVVQAPFFNTEYFATKKLHHFQTTADPKRIWMYGSGSVGGCPDGSWWNGSSSTCVTWFDQVWAFILWGLLFAFIFFVAWILYRIHLCFYPTQLKLVDLSTGNGQIVIDVGEPQRHFYEPGHHRNE